MEMRVYSVFDSKAEAFLQPFFMQAKGQAIRGFTELANDKNHQFGKFPEDYTLFELGIFDDQKGLIVSHQTPVSMGLAVEFVRSEQK